MLAIPIHPYPPCVDQTSHIIDFTGMSAFKDIAKGGWHPGKGKESGSKESRFGDFKGANTVVSMRSIFSRTLSDSKPVGRVDGERQERQRKSACTSGGSALYIKGSRFFRPSSQTEPLPWTRGGFPQPDVWRIRFSRKSRGLRKTAAGGKATGAGKYGGGTEQAAPGAL